MNLRPPDHAGFFDKISIKARVLKVLQLLSVRAIEQPQRKIKKEKQLESAMSNVLVFSRNFRLQFQNLQ